MENPHVQWEMHQFSIAMSVYQRVITLKSPGNSAGDLFGMVNQRHPHLSVLRQRKKAFIKG